MNIIKQTGTGYNCFYKEYQVVKVSPGGSHLGENWERAGSELERAGARGVSRMLY